MLAPSPENHHCPADRICLSHLTLREWQPYEKEKKKNIQPFSWLKALAPKKKEICHFNNSSHNFKRLKKDAQPWLY